MVDGNDFVVVIVFQSPSFKNVWQSYINQKVRKIQCKIPDDAIRSRTLECLQVFWQMIKFLGKLLPYMCCK